jgi:hypothetical protein
MAKGGGDYKYTYNNLMNFIENISVNPENEDEKVDNFMKKNKTLEKFMKDVIRCYYINDNTSKDIDIKTQISKNSKSYLFFYIKGYCSSKSENRLKSTEDTCTFLKRLPHKFSNQITTLEYINPSNNPFQINYMQDKSESLKSYNEDKRAFAEEKDQKTHLILNLEDSIIYENKDFNLVRYGDRFILSKTLAEAYKNYFFYNPFLRDHFFKLEEDYTTKNKIDKRNIPEENNDEQNEGITSEERREENNAVEKLKEKLKGKLKGNKFSF